MEDYSDLIPDEYYSEAIPTSDEHSFLYIGRETISFFSNYWKTKSARLIEKSLSNNDFEEYLDLVDESQECRRKANYLLELATHAESKPLIYRQEPYAVGQRITCFVKNPATRLPKSLQVQNHFVDMVVLKAKKLDSQAAYILRFYQQDGEDTRKYRFIADNVSATPTVDFHYLKVHPNFFRLYLTLRATNSSERAKIEPILSAL